MLFVKFNLKITRHVHTHTRNMNPLYNKKAQQLTIKKWKIKLWNYHKEKAFQNLLSHDETLNLNKKNILQLTKDNNYMKKNEWNKQTK